jgi:tryptophan 7-halogenase
MAVDNIKTVAIVGAGVAGWMSAAFISKMMGRSVAITLLDIGAGNDAAFNNASIPPLKAFHNTLGINEQDLIAKCQGSMKLGTQFVNWGSLGNRYFHPHGGYGAEFDLVPLHQWWLRARSEDASTPDLDDFSMSWALANEGRFSLPAPDRRLIQSTIDYAYHLDAGLYAEYLAQFAKANGVDAKEGSIQKIERDGETGFVTKIMLRDGQSIEADLFIDCSDAQAVLNQSDTGNQFIDWTSYLPCNRAILIRCARGGEFTPYCRHTARDAGWQWRIPMQHHTSMGYVFAGEVLTDDDAIGALMDNLDGPSLSDPITVPFTNGRWQHAFSKNVVAIGSAAGFLEPLEATGLHLIQSALTRLLALWPTRAFAPNVSNVYNELTSVELELARDLLILHYKATTRADTPLWRACKEMAIPESLATRLDHWNTSGRLISPCPELFQSVSWLSVLVGQGIQPAHWDPLADARADQVDYHGRLAGLAKIIRETAPQMPLHREWIDKNARGLRQ